MNADPFYPRNWPHFLFAEVEGDDGTGPAPMASDLAVAPRRLPEPQKTPEGDEQP